MKRYIDIVLTINKGMDFVAGAALILIMLLTSLDVVVRYLGYPIQGSYDIASLMGAFVIGFALPRTAWSKGNITVDLFVEKIPEKRAILDVITRCMSIFLFGMIAWYLNKLGASYIENGEGTLTLGIPFYPVAYALCVCCIVQCLVFIADIVRICFMGGKHE